MLKHPEVSIERISKYAKRFHALFHREKTAVKVEVSPTVGRIGYTEALNLEYRPYLEGSGQTFKPLFATHWFRLTFTVPEAWRDREVDLIFNFDGEGLIWHQGKVLRGTNRIHWFEFEPMQRVNYHLPAELRQGQVTLHIETACNGLLGIWSPAEYKLHEAVLALFDREAWELFHDFYVPEQLLAQLPDKKQLTPWTGHLLATLNRFCNEVSLEDRGTWPAGKALLRGLYDHCNASFCHEASAVGHAHIDTAWLWPLDETRRKCARSFSNALDLMERYPDFKFACSQAHQYQWIKDHYPDLYARIGVAITRGQWIPVGGSWIEPDCNLPSGESLVRQFLHGKRFFRQEFGVDCHEFWNPDVFGYSGALPQILRGVGIENFLTQKLSWNQFNKPPHMNFEWRGIDGSGVLTHFPPANTYNALDGNNAVKGLLDHERGHQDHDRSPRGLLLFGFGDGGGGPSEHMCEVLQRARDFIGLPRTTVRDPREFFAELRRELTDCPVMEGELYFEYHRGTYTTQAATKRDNRRSELALRAAELFHAVAHRLLHRPYPQAELNRLWKLVLVNQFHDILPGSSITEVYEDSARDYAEVLGTTAKIEAGALESLGFPGTSGSSAINTLGWDRSGVMELPERHKDACQVGWNGRPLVLVQLPAVGRAPLDFARRPAVPAVALAEGETHRLENSRLLAVFARDGALVRLLDKQSQREVLPPNTRGNVFVLFDDRPNAWEAWDVDPFHLETRRPIPGAKSVRIVEAGPLRAGLEFVYEFGQSRITQRVLLAADSGLLENDCEVLWHEAEKFLKVETPVAVHAPYATFEIQFGSVRRPTTYNNSHEVARFETCGHRWADLSETGYGVALLNDCKYGYDIHGNVLRLSLLRAPWHPDPKADRGLHRFRFALYPHRGDHIEGEVLRRAHEFNEPCRPLRGTAPAASWLNVDSPHLVIDTVKKAEDGEGVVVRLYEAHGARGRATLRTLLPWSQAQRINLMEEQPTRIEATPESGVPLEFRPFEIITLRLDPPVEQL